MKNPLFDLAVMMLLACARDSKVVLFARWRETRQGGKTTKKRKRKQQRRRQAGCAVLVISPDPARQTQAEREVGRAPGGTAVEVCVRSFFAGLAPDPDQGEMP
jgi:hypothetical protein